MRCLINVWGMAKIFAKPGVRSQGELCELRERVWISRPEIPRAHEIPIAIRMSYIREDNLKRCILATTMFIEVGFEFCNRNSHSTYLLLEYHLKMV